MLWGQCVKKFGVETNERKLVFNDVSSLCKAPYSCIGRVEWIKVCQSRDRAKREGKMTEDKRVRVYRTVGTESANEG